MDNKNFSENGPDNLDAENAGVRDDSLFDDDIYISDSQEAEPSDDDLDISELLRKYLPDFTSDEPGTEKDSVDAASILPENLVSSDNAGTGDLEEYSEELIPEEDSYADYEGTGSEDETSEGEFFNASAESEEPADDVLYGDSYAGMEDSSPSEDYSDYISGEMQDDNYDWEDSVSDDHAPVTEEGEPEDYSEYSYVSDDAPYEDSGEDRESVSVESETPEDANLDATDINLMVAFGLDDELAKTMGPEVAAKIAEEIDAEAKEREDRVRNSVENEYLDASQTSVVAARLKRSFRHLKVKILFAVLLTLLLLFYENLKIFGVQFSGVLNPAVYPVVYIMISLQVMLFCAAVGYEQLLGGAADLFRGKINPKSVAFIGNAAAVVYSVFQAESVSIPNEPALFNACAASMTLFALIYDYFAVKRNILSFNIICSKRPKYAVRYMSAEDAGIPGGLFEADDVSGGGGVLRIEKTKFIDGFFARSEAGTKSGRGYCTAYVFISAVIAALMGVYVGFGGDSSGIGALNAAFVTFFATMPLSLFISMGYPFYKGASNAYDLDGTVIGEASAREYSEAGAVCFDDVDAFPSYGVKVQNI